MAVWPIAARPIPKPAIPCSVRGVLKTRSFPDETKSNQVNGQNVGGKYITKLFSESLKQW